MLDLVNQGQRDAAFEALTALYMEDMRFSDPVSQLDSRHAFIRMNQRFVRSAKTLVFTVLDQAATQDSFFVAWHMRYVPKRTFIPGIDCEGATWCSTQDGLITDHRDYWDLASGLAGSNPLVSKLYRGAIEKVM